MKKKIIIILTVVLVLFCIFFLFYNKNRIKKGEIFSNVTFKEEIPIIKSSKKSSVIIKDVSSNITYTIFYEKIVPNRPLIHFTKETDNEYLSYVYSWEDLPQENSYVYVPKGWSIHKEKRKYINSFSSISNNQIGTITGEVVYTEGNTSIIRKILDNI